MTQKDLTNQRQLDKCHAFVFGRKQKSKTYNINTNRCSGNLNADLMVVFRHFVDTSRPPHGSRHNCGWFFLGHRHQAFYLVYSQLPAREPLMHILEGRVRAQILRRCASPLFKNHILTFNPRIEIGISPQMTCILMIYFHTFSGQGECLDMH